MNDPLCPACSESAGLTPWRSERAGVTVHCCGSCCGAWVQREVVDILGRNAGADLLPLWTGPPVALDQPSRRACPACGSLMDRKACGWTVLDVCGSHGVWFDCEELERFLRWLMERAEAHRRAIGAPIDFGTSGIPPGDRVRVGSGGVTDADLVGAILEGLLIPW